MAHSVDLGDHNLTHITWHNVTVKPGTDVMISILDSGSDEGWSGKVSYPYLFGERWEADET